MQGFQVLDHDHKVMPVLDLARTDYWDNMGHTAVKCNTGSLILPSGKFFFDIEVYLVLDDGMLHILLRLFIRPLWISFNYICVLYLFVVTYRPLLGDRKALFARSFPCIDRMLDCVFSSLECLNETAKVSSFAHNAGMVHH